MHFCKKFIMYEHRISWLWIIALVVWSLLLKKVIETRLFKERNFRFSRAQCRYFWKHFTRLERTIQTLVVIILKHEFFFLVTTIPLSSTFSFENSTPSYLFHKVLLLKPKIICWLTLEKEEKTHSHRQQKSSSFNLYEEKTKRRSKKINETNKIKRRHVCRMLSM